MSLDGEDEDLSKEVHDGPKKERISYTREFLVSLRELDVSKNFPIGFDQSILSEFEGFSHTVHDRQRPPGGGPLQSYKRTEYGASPPTRGDSSNDSRGVHGRWDSRNTDNDSHADWDSDSGRRNQRRTWQNPEHDGLLGSGSLPRTSGFSAGTSAPKTRANDPGQLSRSNEPYQPPRPYKAVPHPRRDTHDSINDETFGSSDTSEDRVEEERKRRANFELMRKEQHKTFHEKHRDDSFSDTTPSSAVSKDENLWLTRNKETNDLLKIPSSSVSSKPLLPSQTIASTRPLVPPGFTISSLERDVGTKSGVHPLPPEVKKSEIKDHLVHAIGTPLQNSSSTHHETPAKQLAQNLKESEVQLDSKNRDIPLRKLNEKLKIASEISNRKIPVDDDSYMSSNISEASDLLELGAEKNKGEKRSATSEDQSTSILEKLFDSALRVKSGESSFATEDHDNKIDDDTWNPNVMQSSRFAHWFHEEEKKPVDGPCTEKTNDLLSFIAGKEGVQLSDTKPRQKMSPDFLGNSDFMKRDRSSDIKSANAGVSEKLYLGNKPPAVPMALTCEDLEQSILSEISGSKSVMQPPVQELDHLKEKASQVKNNIDNHASQHLLSMLNKGSGHKYVGMSSSLEAFTLPQQPVSEASRMGPVNNNPIETTPQKVQDVGKTITLETLFGTAFMNELQSFEAPVSVHRASVGPERADNPESHELHFPHNNNSTSHSTSHSIKGENRSNWNLHESPMLAPNHILQSGADKADVGRWLGFNDPRSEMNPSKLQTEVGFNLGGFNGVGTAGYPKEDSLIIEGATLSHRNSLNRNKSGGSSDKLGTLNSVFKDERPMIEPDIRYQNLHGQPSSSQLLHSQINHGRAMLHPLDSHSTHINAQMNFPDNTVRHDPFYNHHFSSSMLQPPFRHPNADVTGFNSPARHALLHEMRRAEKLPPSHPMQGFPGATNPHLNNQAAGFIQDPMQGLSFAQHPNFSGPGFNLQGIDNRPVANHPELLQWMMEMERRSNAKQMHPSPPHHDMETGFRSHRIWTVVILLLTLNRKLGYPKEDSLIIEGATLSHRNSLNRNKSGGSSDKLGTLNSVFKDERPMIEPDIRYQNLHGQPSSSQLLHSQINHGRAMLHPLDSHSTHINAQMNFPDNTVRHDPFYNHHFSSSMLQPPFRHPNADVTGFNSPARHALLHEMRRPEKLPPSHPMQGFPGATNPHLNNQAAGFIQDPMQGLSFAQHPNFSGPGMNLQGIDNRPVANHPELLQWMMEMERRSNAKQMHPSPPHHDMETGFRYR